MAHDNAITRAKDGIMRTLKEELPSSTTEKLASRTAFELAVDDYLRDLVADVVETEQKGRS